MSGQLGGPSPQTGAHAVVANAVDPARRPDVLLRVRREEGHEISAWWMIGAFVGVSALVIGLLSFVPGGA
ncbi:UNVERIFIED_CONTAM: UDP-N-acetylmuramyl pentapeptide phosphotransferase [Microbacterium sp. SLM126]